MKELDTVDGIGLIERRKTGFGRADTIYVKNFNTGKKVAKTEASDGEFKNCTYGAKQVDSIFQKMNTFAKKYRLKTMRFQKKCTIKKLILRQ